MNTYPPKEQEIITKVAKRTQHCMVLWEVSMSAAETTDDGYLVPTAFHTCPVLISAKLVCHIFAEIST